MSKHYSSTCLKFFFSILVFLTTTCAHAEIIEISDLSHILPYAKKGTLYAFDLDNTLIRTKHYLASDMWFSHEIQRKMNKGLDFRTAQDHTASIWTQLMNNSHMCLVDPGHIDILAEITKRSAHMIGLTKRRPSMMHRTHQQLSALNIDFSSSCPHAEELFLEDLFHYGKGSVFCFSDAQKGTVLVAFLKHIGYIPECIVMVDDKLEHLKHVEEAVAGLGIPFIGFRYSGADEWVKSFDPRIAEIQHKHYPEMISNEKAREILENQLTTTSRY